MRPGPRGTAAAQGTALRQDERADVGGGRGQQGPPPAPRDRKPRME